MADKISADKNFAKDSEHKRRVHYSGKYPKRYEEKYKELQPEKYTDIAEHVKKKGNTPAGTHISIMVNEILDVLKIKPGMRGLDCTFGYGGHSQKMLENNSSKTELEIKELENEKQQILPQDIGKTIINTETEKKDMAQKQIQMDLQKMQEITKSK